MIGCLAKTGQDQHLKLSPQSHILFYKVFLDKEHSEPPGKYLWKELFKSPQTLFFPDFAKDYDLVF